MGPFWEGATNLVVLGPLIYCIIAPTDKEQCSSNKKDRKNCGHSGISARDCYSKGCCYDPSDRKSFIPLYFISSLLKGCAVTHKNRKDCGYPYISAKDCFSRGCCFDDSVPQTIWCYYGNCHFKY
uniref:P-type domain-containing protein n=1 Tax=Xenopus tropicalis TaxID=8364 RepID=A0A6I8R057_XENTR